MICASIILLAGHLIFGTVYLTMLSCPTVNILYLKLHFVSSAISIIYDFKAEVQGTRSRSWY